MLESIVARSIRIWSITKQFGFAAKRLSDHPAKAVLKQIRKNPNTLTPGDRPADERWGQRCRITS
jgi:hypothetical protein